MIPAPTMPTLTIDSLPASLYYPRQVGIAETGMHGDRHHLSCHSPGGRRVIDDHLCVVCVARVVVHELGIVDAVPDPGDDQTGAERFTASLRVGQDPHGVLVPDVGAVRGDERN